MTNKDVLVAFLKGDQAKTPTRNIQGRIGNTLKTDGLTLINYSTKLAYKKDNKLYLNIQKYSTTTSKIQTQLATLAPYYYNAFDIIRYADDI